VIRAALEECKKLKNEKVSAEELNKVKEYLIGNMKLSLESSDDLANFYGGEEILKRQIRTPDQKAAEIRKVTAAQIQNLAQDIFKESKTNLALIGPFKNKAPFLRLLKF
jgi:predicted Zn-dependent peptidase